MALVVIAELFSSSQTSHPIRVEFIQNFPGALHSRDRHLIFIFYSFDSFYPRHDVYEFMTRV